MNKAQLADYALFLDYAIGRISDKYLKRYVRKLRRRCSITRYVVFCTDIEVSPSTTYQKFRKMTPFPFIEPQKRYDHSRDNEKYYRKMDRFVEIVSGQKALPIFNLFPARYISMMYGGRCLQGYGMFDEAARPSQVRYIQNVMAILRKYYEEDEIWIELSNEVQHGGDHALGRKLAMQHRVWFEATGLPLNRVIIDSSHSEYVHFELIEKNRDPDGFEGGDDKYSRNKNIHVKDEHGVGLARHISEPTEPGGHSREWAYTSSGWKNAIAVFNSDGNTWGHGDKYVLHEDRPEGAGYRNADNDELYDKCVAVWQLNPRHIVEELPMEIWVRDPEDYQNAITDRKKLKKGRLRQIRKARKYVVGGE